MSTTAFFFPGQASQYVGMGKDLYEHSDAVRRLYALASELVGDDLARLSFEGPAETLRQTRFTQPAILVHSLSVLTVLSEQLPAFDFAAGHSLGEYGALAVTGVLSFEQALKAVARRAVLMEDACRAEAGTMAAIMGLSLEQVTQICEKAKADGIVVPANINSPVQIVISGQVKAVETAVALARDAGAKRALLLEVGGAFHSPLMASARAGLAAFLEEIPFREPRKPVVPNVTATPETSGPRLKELLVEQLTAPVRWADTMTALSAQGVSRIIEIGPGKVLAGLAKRAMRPDQLINLDRLEQITAFLQVHV